MGEKQRKKIKIGPPMVLSLGFAGLILIGALILNLPISSADGQRIGFINALFTSSSAVCVTGLTVKNTAEQWSSFGHVVIILLIQFGGLGFMTMATIGALLIGKKITLRERLVIKEQLNQDNLSGLVKLTKYVVFATLFIEFVGALLLSIRFIPVYGIGKGIWFSVFHSISAFCNAGFDLIGDSLAPFYWDVIINLTIAFLIILGGLGFTVFIDISKNKLNYKSWSLHTKMVLFISVLLLLVGTVLIFVIEYNNVDTLQPMTFGEKWLAAFFQSTAARTAGYYSVNLGKLHESTIVLSVVLMFIGASPGSTGGGIKTTTFGALLLTTMAVIKGKKDVVAFKKRISYDIINRSIAIVGISMMLILTVTFVLTVTEDASFLDILYETTSAFATVGSSRDLTPNLTNFGKIIVTLTMYVGRVGPLTLAYLFAKRSKVANFRYSEGNIMVG